MVDHLEELRLAELEAVRPHLPRSKGLRILEIGAGNGWQASVLAGWGYEVNAIDVPERIRSARQYFPVRDYDGTNIPFAAEQFDIVFSSNVMEHVKQLPELLLETRRVLKAGAVAIHVLPTPAWRLWTSLSHYGYLMKRLLWGRPSQSWEAPSPNVAEAIRQKGAFRVLSRILVAGPHGEYPNALAELYYFSKRRWLKVFRGSGFAVLDALPAGVFYTGYSLVPRLGVGARRSLARLLGSACRIYVMKK
jgi:SAM-dependent methyltransferase